VDTFIY